MTSGDKRELGFAIFASVIGGIVGYAVTKKSHPVVGTVAGVFVGALIVPATAEALKGSSS